MATPAEWKIAFDLIDKVLDLPSAEREPWLATIDPAHAHLLPLVREAMAEQPAKDALPSLPRLTGFDRAHAQSFLGEAGTLIGPYRLIRELGTGGMGSVWLAARADGAIKREVALKLPHAGKHKKQLAERFRHELNILAALDHPHIARLYDAGVADDGQPYMALEYVDGAAIDRYCRSANLDVRGKLTLFLQVMDAVHFAHTHLVIHRDLKPSNILVTTDGQVRLLDFGIAKLLAEEEPAENNPQTEFSQRVFTPEYASPEQVTGNDIGTASDEYSLAVILYELICGQPPYKLKRQSRGALEDAIVEAVISRPSTQWKPSASEINGATSASRWSWIPNTSARAHGISAELDAIVLKALAKRPQDRYDTVAALAQDLRNHLANRPITARPPSTFYQLRKLVQRHKVASALLASATITLLVATNVSIYQAHKATREAKTANEIKDFLIATFRNTNPVDAKGADFTARQLLDQSAAEAERHFKDAPAIQAELYETFSRSYGQLGREDLARAFSEKAVTNLTQALGANDPRVQRAKAQLADSYLSAFDVAAYRRVADDLRSQCTTPLAEQSADSHCWLAAYLEARYTLQSGRIKECEQRMRSIIAAARIVKPGPTNWAGEYADVYIMLSLVARGKTADGAAVLIPQIREHLSADTTASDTVWASDLGYLSRILLENGDLRRAREANDIAVALRKRQFGNTPLWNYGHQRRAAIIDAALGDVARAQALFSDAVAGSERRFGGANYDSAGSNEAWGLMLLAEGQLEQARARFVAARSVHTNVAIKGNRWLERIDASLAVLDGLSGRREAARAALDREIVAAETAEDTFAARRARYWRARFSDDPTEARALLLNILDTKRARSTLEVDALILLAEIATDKPAQLGHLREAVTESARIWGLDNRKATDVLERASSMRPDAAIQLRTALVEPPPTRDEVVELVAAIQARTEAGAAAAK